MRSLIAITLGAVALAGCRPSARPDARPAPVVPAAAVAPAPVLAGEERTAPPDAPNGQAPTAGEISRRATDVFGGRPAAGGPAAEGDAADAADAPSWDIAVAEYESHDRVEFYVRRYTGPARSWVTERLSRGTRYEALIRDRLRAGGMPEDMYFLAFVESGFDPNASSRAAAVGIWQFMAPTAKGMGLRVDWWVDERRDPVRSTDAAVRFLRGLHAQFGSLYLAAAAYNGGPARIARGLTRFAGELDGTEGEDRFFTLSEQEFLPRETREYVPQIIAAALVGKDPARYGLSIETREPFAYDSVDVPALTSLPAVARAAGTTMVAIRDLNPHLIRAVTPPRRHSTVRIPAGTRERFESAFATLEESKRTGVRTVRLTEVKSLANAAKKFNTTPAAIRNFNPKLKRTPRGNLDANQSLLIPDADVAASALDVPDPSLGITGSTRFHVVKSGETLGHIAQRYGTTVATLQRLNHLKKALIFPGQELVVNGTAAKRR